MVPSQRWLGDSKRKNPRRNKEKGKSDTQSFWAGWPPFGMTLSDAGMSDSGQRDGAEVSALFFLDWAICRYSLGLDPMTRLKAREKENGSA